MTLRHLLAAAALLTAIPFFSSAQTDGLMKVPVRNAGDDGSAAYRIPGLVTTPKGTLIAVYDIRYAGAWDLQADIDVGMSRSTDGGKTWEPMKVIIDMGEWGGLSQEENGVGDPSVLVDPSSGKLFALGTWTHGIKGQRAWTAVGDGFEPGKTAQLMMVVSDDDGLTWSEPRNLTRMIKQKDWRFTFQGPGRGIVMADGTLVFPMQYINAERIPSSTVMVSHDGGETWIMGTGAKLDTTESQVIESDPGVLMLNMRDNRGTGRAVATSTDYGQSWTEHPTSGRLEEPVCMASILKVPAAENCLGRDLVLFSNPADPQWRWHMTVKASLDGGWTWLEENQLMYDPDGCWGYSCLTMVDPETVGILYESATAHMMFVSIPLREIVKVTDMPLSRKDLSPLPLAVSAPFIGYVGKHLLVAGGADFPDVPAALGGEKKHYAGIWKLDGSGSWKMLGNLPVGTAYGASFEEGKTLLLAGGHLDSGHSTDGVWRLDGKGRLKPAGTLPKPLEQMGFSRNGKTLFLAGGLSDGVPSREVYAWNGKAWKVVAVLPEALVQPVLFATSDALYIWGGYDGESRRLKPNGYRLDLETGLWRSTAPVPDGGTFVGASGATLPDGRLAVVGGVNREIFEKALQAAPEGYLTWSPGVYQFRDTVWVFDPETESWQCLGESGHSALAGAGVAAGPGGLTVVGGEVKPGIRTSAAGGILLSDLQ